MSEISRKLKVGRVSSEVDKIFKTITQGRTKSYLLM